MTPRPCVERYGPHEFHGIDCATVQEWNEASRALRATAGSATLPSPTAGDVITLPEYLNGLADGREVIDRNGTVWTATEHQLPTGRMWTTGGSSLSSRGLLNGGPVTLLPDAPTAAPPSPTQVGSTVTLPISVVFDGPPGPISGRFIDVEDDSGNGLRVGEWIERVDGMWSLRITALPTSAPTAGVDREALAFVLSVEFGSFLAHDPHTPERFWGQAADAVIRHLATRPTPSSVDADAVERAVYDAIERHWPDAFNGCESNVTECDQGEDCAADVARAALAAARAGGGGVTAEQVERAARKTWESDRDEGYTGSWIANAETYRRILRANLAALGIEVQR